MAIHTSLAIYKASYELLGVVIDLARGVPRDLKLLIGGELRDGCVDINNQIFRANVALDKAPYLNALIERTQAIELLLRLSRDKRCISTKQYAAAIALTTSVGKQATGWRNAASRLSHGGQGHHA